MLHHNTKGIAARRCLLCYVARVSLIEPPQMPLAAFEELCARSIAANSQKVMRKAGVHDPPITPPSGGLLFLLLQSVFVLLLKCRLRHLKRFAPHYSNESAESHAQSGVHDPPADRLSFLLPPSGGLFLFQKASFTRQVLPRLLRESISLRRRAWGAVWRRAYAGDCRFPPGWS